MDELITWLTTTSIGLIVLGIAIAYFIKNGLQSNSENEEIQENTKRKKSKTKEKTVVITETKITKIKNLDKDSYEKIISRDSNRNNSNVSD